MQGKRSFLLQALLMTGVSLLLRFVGVSAQIIIAGKIGSEAVGIFSLVGGVGGFAATLALSGISIGTTQLIAQEKSHQNAPPMRRTLYVCLFHAIAFGLFSSALLMLGSHQISTLWLHDPRTCSSLRIMAFSLPLMSLSSCIGGYFVAVRRAYKSATIQVAEEFLRIGCTIFLLNRMASCGVESALNAIAYSNVIADIFSTLSLFLLFAFDTRKNFHLSGKHLPNLPCSSYFSILRRLLSVTMPVALATYIRSGLITLEHTLIPIGMQHFGLTQSQALSTYGLVHSMALPVVLFPAALSGAFAGLLVPEVTEATALGQQRRIRGMAERAGSLTLLYAVGCAGILLAFAYPLGMLLYDTSNAASYIRLLAPLLPIMYIDSVTDAFLKGLGEHLYSMKVNILDAATAVLLVWLLVPSLGIIGYIMTIYITELFNAALSILRLFKRCHPDFRYMTRHLIGSLLAIIGATGLLRLLLHAFPEILPSPSTVRNLIVLIGISILFYCVFLTLLGIIRREDFRWFLTYLFSNQKKDDRP